MKLSTILARYAAGVGSSIALADIALLSATTFSRLHHRALAGDFCSPVRRP